MYSGALVPGLLVGLYILFTVVVVFKPVSEPALPQEARIYREPTGSRWDTVPPVLALICTAVGFELGAGAQPVADLAGAQHARTG
jgi:TRAP-type mannitol/chloroaromatic compound transport system permease large subunit